MKRKDIHSKNVKEEIISTSNLARKIDLKLRTLNLITQRISADRRGFYEDRDGRFSAYFAK